MSAESRLTPVQPRPLNDEVANVLRESIAKGRFGRGERLVETKLAAELGVSRGPIREALRTLSSEGLVTESPGRGAFVVTLSPEDLGEIYTIRAALEAEAVRAITAAVEPAVLDELRMRIAEIGAAVGRGDPQEVWARDTDFHEAMCRLSGNRRLYSMWLSQVRILRALFVSEAFPHKAPEKGVESHSRLLDLILAGDPETAAAETREHAINARESAIAYLRALPDRTSPGKGSGPIRS